MELWASLHQMYIHELPWQPVYVFWMTFQQAKELGGFVKMGQHGSPVVYAATFKKTETSEGGEEVEQDIYYSNGPGVLNLKSSFAAM